MSCTFLAEIHITGRADPNLVIEALREEASTYMFRAMSWSYAPFGKAKPAFTVLVRQEVGGSSPLAGPNGPATEQKLARSMLDATRRAAGNGVTVGIRITNLDAAEWVTAGEQ